MIRLCEPYTDNAELEAVAEVLSSGYLTQGKKVEEFENLVADFVGTKYAFGTSSCTTALHLSLVALGIGAGDEVLVPDFTFPATANVVVQQQAIPVFVDIDLDTFNISKDDLANKINKRTKAIIPVHAFGLSADMDPITHIAKEHNLYIIEDAACALGAKYNGIHCGSIGDVGCFSFHPRKSITTGEGGIIATNDEKIANNIRVLRNHGGIRKGNRFSFEKAGFNYRMSDIHGAIGVEQMHKIEKILAMRKELAGVLFENLKNNNCLVLPSDTLYSDHTFQSYVVFLNVENERDDIIEKMQKHDIETTVGTYALHMQPYFSANYYTYQGELPNSKKAYQKTLTLPLYPTMTVKQINYVTSILLSLLNESQVNG